ncbi:hypothetical protein CJF42_11025 [Pseudoalteromonas sp. NBT06-2]|uniref:hypothetical protein n=1 Tax=Pseudoalteromonas sp. NBT06-2 TaxID=2025950 RepID=UPI000BA5DAD1|nr:hypothetical protein [Pseudoalteromonas sp. NBT06-2]PAJ74315.1 hypothetical protein CJF42_11025 [Pseudoalteromonas sp. NBT06-2]
MVWVYTDNTSSGGISGEYSAGNWLKIHDRTMKIGVGSISFEFNPAKTDCTQGLSFNLEVGEDTVSVFKPNCDELLDASITYPISHYFDLIPDVIKPKVVVPLDPLGLFQIGVKFGVGVEVGAEFTAGGVIGGHNNEQPFTPNEVRNPDYIYASIEPYVGGQISGTAYTTFGHGVAEAGVKGKFNIVKVKAKGYMEAGIRRIEDEGNIKEQGFLELKVTEKLSGGDGKLDAYCKKLWGLLYLSANLMKWDPIYTYERTFFEYASPTWENL